MNNNICNKKYKSCITTFIKLRNKNKEFIIFYHLYILKDYVRTMINLKDEITRKRERDHDSFE